MVASPSGIIKVRLNYCIDDSGLSAVGIVICHMDRRLIYVLMAELISASIKIHFQGEDMYKKSIQLFLFSTICCSAAVWAAESLKPGLWEMTMKSDAMKAMPKMTPEQMEQMRKMGVNLPQMQDGGMVMKVCITKEMAERDPASQTHQVGSECKSKNFQRSGSNYSVDIVCDGAHMKGEGKGQGTFSGNERFTSTYDFKGTSGGRPVTQHQETSGKWMGADCGDVKPVGNYMKKNMQ
ncbi:MAG: DUF3617 domain-containing protein [Burkholderiaceae bacterium]